MVEWVSTNTSIRRKRHERTYRVSNENYNSNPAREELARSQPKELSVKAKFRLTVFDWYSELT